MAVNKRHFLITYESFQASTSLCLVYSIAKDRQAAKSMPGKVASLFQPQGEAEVTQTAWPLGWEIDPVSWEGLDVFVFDRRGGVMWDRPLEMEIAQIDDRQFGSGRSFICFQDGLHPEV